jgi:hypothetical protein
LLLVGAGEDVHGRPLDDLLSQFLGPGKVEGHLHLRVGSFELRANLGEGFGQRGSR